MKPNAVGRVGGHSPQAHPVFTPGRNPGFVSGTILLSQDGEMPVEFLSPGDRIITRDSGMVQLQAIRRRRIIARAISFAAGSLGHTRPEQDLILPAGQVVLIRDWRAEAMFGRPQAMVRADALVDGTFICDLGLQKMTLYQLQFADLHVLYVGGMEVACATKEPSQLCPAA
ncbi:MAG: hypothetical protein ACI8R4_000927 [Paracoccaceae bacterium]|jgi:hypothetical protein